MSEPNTDAELTETDVPHVDDWEDHYPTATYRGPHQYPVPEDWVLDIVEGDGVMWDRFEDDGHGCEHDSDVIEKRGHTMNAGTPDETASLGPEANYEYVEDEDGEFHRQPIADPADHKLSINGQTIFKAYDPVDPDRLWAATAAILARHARGEEYDEVVATVDDHISTDDHSLGEFA